MIFFRGVLLAGIATGVRIERSAGSCVESAEHALAPICAANEQENCEKAMMCCWSAADASCYVNTEEINSCPAGKMGDCTLQNEGVSENLAGGERHALNETEKDILVQATGALGDEEGGDASAKEARSSFFNMLGGGANMFGGGMTGLGNLIPTNMMSIGQQIAQKYVGCPVNVPFCQRLACSSSSGNPQMNAFDCLSIPGCCFDNDLFIYISALGGGFIKAPVCYRAIRTPIFHMFAGQITQSGQTFFPNLLEPIASKVENFISDPKTFNLMLEYHQCVSTHPSAPSRMNFERHLMLSWPAYNWMKMMGKGDRIIADLVNAFSQTCGWPNIEKGECMMIGCCWNIDAENCNHATDLTKIPSETLVKVAGMLMLSTGEKEEEDTTDGGATPPGLSTGQRFGNFGAPPPLNSAPSSGASPPFSLPGPLPGALGGLTGRRRRNAVKRRKRRQFQNPLAMQLTPQQLLIQQLMNGGNAQPQLFPHFPGGASPFPGGASPFPGGSAPFPGPLGNMMGAFSDQQQCAAANPILNCMEPFDEGKQPDFSALIDGKNKCQVKGCCWDNNIQTSILLGNANSAFDQLNQHQCEWKTPTIGSNWGFPDLTQSYRGCCTKSPCVHTEVPAEWTEWGDWTTCSHQCGGGRQDRSRSCVGNGFCPGMQQGKRDELISRECNASPCEKWTTWSPWSQCSSTCGFGAHNRQRVCLDMTGNQVQAPGQSGGCRGDGMMTTACDMGACPAWRNWSSWSVCTAKCGMGMRSKRRSCTVVGMCPGESTGAGSEAEACGEACWTEWAIWSQCSASCYGGKRQRTRGCSFEHETGKSCPGSATEVANCNTDFCENWNAWSQWTPCVSNAGYSCGAGTQEKYRNCEGGMPGAPGCSGPPSQQQTCSLGPCQWSEWAQTTQCQPANGRCGRGSATYERICPGTGCVGSNKMTKTCTGVQCPGWQPWSDWSECSKTCGSGTSTRERSCNGRINIDCRGSVRSTKSCWTGVSCPWNANQGSMPFNNQNTQNTQTTMGGILNPNNRHPWQTGGLTGQGIMNNWGGNWFGNGRRR